MKEKSTAGTTSRSEIIGELVNWKNAEEFIWHPNKGKYKSVKDVKDTFWMASDISNSSSRRRMKYSVEMGINPYSRHIIVTLHHKENILKAAGGKKTH